MQTKQPIEPDTDALVEKLNRLGKPVVMKDHIKRLEETELAQAKQLGLEAFKFDNNDEMLRVMGLAQTA